MSFNNKMQQEIDKWTKEELISAETATTLRERYPIKKRSMTQTLALLGSTLLGVGVILFFAANWQVIPRTIKVLLVILSFTSSYITGYYLKEVKKTYPQVGYALIFLGSILYGSAIWLIAQIFHIEAENGLGFFLWYLGVIPIAYLFKSSLNLALALINLTIWFIAGNHPLGLSYLIFPLLLGCTTLPLALYKRDLGNLALIIPSFYIWFISLGAKLAPSHISFHYGILSLLLFSLILYFLVPLLRKKHFFGEKVLLGFSLSGMFISLIPFTFHSFVAEFANIFTLDKYTYLIAAVLIILIGIKTREKKLSLHDIPFIVLYPCLFLYFPVLSQSSLVLVLNNILFFLLILLTIYYTYSLKQPLLFNLSIVMFAVAIILKYFDLFFALLPRSVFFMAGGLLLIIISFFLENKRRNLLKTMERGV